MRLNLYYTMIYPYLSYGNMIWASNYDSRLLSLVTLQKRIMRIILGIGYRESTRQGFQNLKVMRFENINRYLIGIFMYKFINNLLPHSSGRYFVRIGDLHGYNTRAAGGLFKYYARTNYRQFSISYRGPVVWNDIPRSMQELRTVTMFKSSWKVLVNSDVKDLA